MSVYISISHILSHASNQDSLVSTKQNSLVSTSVVVSTKKKLRKQNVNLFSGNKKTFSL